MSTITSQTTINNRLTALIREKNDAIGSNDSTCIFTSAATLPTPPPLSFSTLLYNFWTLTHTHTHCSPSLHGCVCWYDAGGKQSSVCPERTNTRCCLAPKPTMQHHHGALLTRIRKVSLQKPREQNSSSFPASYCSKFFPTNPYSKEAPMGEKRLRQDARSGPSRFNVPLCCSTCNRTGVTNR